MDQLYTSPHRGAPMAARYLLAIALSIGAAFITRHLASFLEPMRFFFFWVVILISAVYGGAGPGMTAVGISALAVVWTMEPRASLQVLDPVDLGRLIVFIFFATTLTLAVGARRSAEDRAQRLRQWLATALGSIGDAVIATDRQGLIVFVNEEAVRLTGVAVKAAIGQPIESVYHTEPAQSAALTDVLRRVLGGGTAESSEDFLLRSAAGDRFPIQQSATTIRTRDAVSGMVVVFHDISRRRQRDETMRLSEERFRAFVKASSQLVFTTGPTGEMSNRDLSGAQDWEELTGSPETDWVDSVHPDDRAGSIHTWQESLKGRESFQYDLRLRIRSGGYRWFQVRVVPLLDPDGSVREWVGTLTDIDDSRRAEDETRFINDASILLSSSLDYETTIRSLTRLAVPRYADWCAVDMAREQGGYARLEVAHVDPGKVALGYAMNERYPPRPEEDLVAAVLSTGQSTVGEITEELLQANIVDEEHLALLRELGLRSWMLVPMTARGRTFGVITFVSAESGRVYTERDLPLAEDLARRAAVAIDNALLYREAEKANRAKDEFLATLSHELRTPLTAILGWARLLQMSPADAETQKQALETIERSAKAQAELVEDILDISRIVTGKFQLTLSSLDLGELAGDVVAALGPTAQARRVTVELTRRGAIPVSGDSIRLKQVVWNLLSNAIKFSSEGGIVRIEVRSDAHRVYLVVTDEGRGIDASFLPHVWERFRQADSSTTRQYGGLGLGLAVVKHVAELHGGAVAVTSAGLGQGATFTVELPVDRPADDRVSAAGSKRENLGVLAGRKVVVVEDDDDARRLITTILERYGATVRAFPGVRDALAGVDVQAPDLIVTDIAMPEEDGFALVRQLRARPQAAGIPVIAVSALGGAADLSRIMAGGFDDFLSKPVDPAKLVEHVLALLVRRGT